MISADTIASKPEVATCRDRPYLTRRVHLVQQGVAHQRGAGSGHRTRVEAPDEETHVEPDRQRHAAGPEQLLRMLLRVVRLRAAFLDQEREHDHLRDRREHGPRKAKHLLAVHGAQLAHHKTPHDLPRTGQGHDRFADRNTRR